MRSNNFKPVIIIFLLVTLTGFHHTFAESTSLPDNGIIAPPEHRRSTEQTFLTYPEWFLVHSPAEYALFIKDHPSSDFPYFGHIKQFWEGYAAVYHTTKDKYPVNVGYHVMVMVIGISTTVEYAIKSVYETLIGRVSLLARTHGMTEEDIFAAQVAQEYVDFIRVIPWYEFDFASKLKLIWSNTNLFGPDLLRKWERKYALSTEYAIKAGYAVVIKKLTQMGYEPPLPVTAIVVDELSPTAKIRLPDLEILQEQPDGSVLITVPRYAAFKEHAAALAEMGSNFIEIAGNRSIILVSLLTPESWQYDSHSSEILLTQPILTQTGIKRVILVIPVQSLASELNQFSHAGISIEHVYDF